MKLSDYTFHLPEELIAEKPASPRDHSRLLILDKKSGDIEHKHFYDIIDQLNSGDTLVLNNSKVFPARLKGKKKGTGGKAEVFLHQEISPNTWECIIGGYRVNTGSEVEFPEGLTAKLLEELEDMTFKVEFNKSGADLMATVEKIGQIPLPPYIERKRKHIGFTTDEDKDNYQTVYAADDKKGSVAVPTAGLHFTPELIEKLKHSGIKFEYITLHVGIGTFAPVRVENVKEHKMHAEWVEIKPEVLKRLRTCKKAGHKIITVGTTSTRSLEAAWQKSETELADGFVAWVDIFIYPGYKFKIVDAIITNFHLPESTLLMLVSALAGKENIDKAYTEAIKEKYRFYSYGDAMFIK